MYGLLCFFGLVALVENGIVDVVVCLLHCLFVGWLLVGLWFVDLYVVVGVAVPVEEGCWKYWGHR